MNFLGQGFQKLKRGIQRETCRHTDRCDRKQNATALLITRTGRRQHITPVLRELHWLPVRQRI